MIIPDILLCNIKDCNTYPLQFEYRKRYIFFLIADDIFSFRNLISLNTSNYNSYDKKSEIGKLLQIPHTIIVATYCKQHIIANIINKIVEFLSNNANSSMFF